MLPNLLVIGAAKCGTTSLHEYLDAHPEIAMSREKELDFFVEEKNWGRGVTWYEAQFEDAPVRGESSVAYSAYPFYQGVPERITMILDDAKIVYLVRDPLDRIVSHYQHRSLSYPEMGSLADALEDAGLRAWFVAVSRYWLQLEQYLAQLPHERVLVVDSDDLRNRREKTLARVFGFLGVDPTFRPPDLQRSYNEQVGQTRPNAAGRRLLRALQGTIGSERSSAAAARVPSAMKSAFRNSVPRASLSPTLREQLAAELAADVAQLRSHTGLALAGWSL
jgi:hypothetical protein